MNLAPDTPERMWRAVARVEVRLLTSTAALDAAGIEHAVIGGNAVAAWVAAADEGAVRNTPELNLLVLRDDLPAVIRVLDAVGFDHVPSDRNAAFVDRPNGSIRSGVFFTFAGEFVKPDNALPAARLSERIRGPKFWLIALQPLVRMKLTAWRNKDIWFTSATSSTSA